MPIGIVRQALSEILLITLVNLKAHVDRVAKETVEREGFPPIPRLYGQGRTGTRVEPYFIVPKACLLEAIDRRDSARGRIGPVIGGEGDNRWLMIAFTGDARWTE